MNTKLKLGEEVITDIEKIRVEYDENKQRLIENKIVNSNWIEKYSQKTDLDARYVK